MRLAIIILGLIFVPVLYSTNPRQEDFQKFLLDQAIQAEKEQAPILFFGQRSETPEERATKWTQREEYYLFSVYTHLDTSGEITRYLGVGKRFVRLP
ncbi:MAG: hypothetical protein KatS3mg044_1343 [Rhodothermaceae bacterium]|nr:MAG: hypothetical protein KatS3mg044_1343 [Rhodothermaceae bacterium]